MSMSVSTCGQEQAEWWELVVIVGAHIVVGTWSDMVLQAKGWWGQIHFSKSKKYLSDLQNYLSDVNKFKKWHYGRGS